MIDTETKLNAAGIPSLDSLIHSQARLVIVYQLYKTNTLDFIQLMKILDFTWGNLSTHLSKLEDGGYVSITKTFNDKRPYTMISLTESGRQAYISWCKSVLRLMPTSIVNAYTKDAEQAESDESESLNNTRNDILEEQFFVDFFPHDYNRLDKNLLPIQEFNKL